MEPKHGMPALVLEGGEKTMLQGLRLALRFVLPVQQDGYLPLIIHENHELRSLWQRI